MGLWGGTNDAVADTLRAALVVLRDDLALAVDRYNKVLDDHNKKCAPRLADAENVCRAAVAEQDARIALECDDNTDTRHDLSVMRDRLKAAVSEWRGKQEGGE